MTTALTVSLTVNVSVFTSTSNTFVEYNRFVKYLDDLAVYLAVTVTCTPLFIDLTVDYIFR